uniref:Uncharacterized protein n=1 Tax=Romanomermis culicivorax TaxID=13658 RepID=A0A915L7B8_ROMCU
MANAIPKGPRARNKAKGWKMAVARAIESTQPGNSRRLSAGSPLTPKPQASAKIKCRTWCGNFKEFCCIFFLRNRRYFWKRRKTSNMNIKFAVTIRLATSPENLPQYSREPHPVVRVNVRNVGCRHRKKYAQYKSLPFPPYRPWKACNAS